MANILFCTYLAMSTGLVVAGAPGVAELRYAGILVICMILAIGVHEFAHAYTAHRLGDPTPESQGRLTLNPIAHMDPIGTLALPIALGLFSKGMLFGWGRPVETQSRYFTRRITMRGGMALVAFAGPLSNLVQAALTLGVLWILFATGVLDRADLAAEMHPLATPLLVFYSLNVLLFAFNLLPVHPLDGGKVLAWILGPKYQHIDDFLARYGFVILLVLMFAVPVVLHKVFGPVMAGAEWALHAVVS
ncbi:site-2 protease family protein [Paraliomyxa miuraensis]|uniref:site-2 protease family protein n=1 Tax=Paraliomyxa miuraensis TaxID=376150 RepID=UPI0022572E3D|nr:site-2 protease family protein [Paraliomyxa miuraensis]MCX4245779.1 site-2 protease family protein [Paraliomyxa miuraensis]